MERHSGGQLQLGVEMALQPLRHAGRGVVGQRGGAQQAHFQRLRLDRPAHQREFEIAAVLAARQRGLDLERIDGAAAHRHAVGQPVEQREAARGAAAAAHAGVHTHHVLGAPAQVRRGAAVEVGDDHLADVALARRRAGGRVDDLDQRHVLAVPVLAVVGRAFGAEEVEIRALARQRRDLDAQRLAELRARLGAERRAHQDGAPVWQRSAFGRGRGVLGHGAQRGHAGLQEGGLQRARDLDIARHLRGLVAVADDPLRAGALRAEAEDVCRRRERRDQHLQHIARPQPAAPVQARRQLDVAVQVLGVEGLVGLASAGAGRRARQHDVFARHAQVGQGAAGAVHRGAQLVLGAQRHARGKVGQASHRRRVDPREAFALHRRACLDPGQQRLHALQLQGLPVLGRHAFGRGVPHGTCVAHRGVSLATSRNTGSGTSRSGNATCTRLSTAMSSGRPSISVNRNQSSSSRTRPIV